MLFTRFIIRSQSVFIIFQREAAFGSFSFFIPLIERLDICSVSLKVPKQL